MTLQINDAVNSPATTTTKFSAPNYPITPTVGARRRRLFTTPSSSARCSDHTAPTSEFNRRPISAPPLDDAAEEAVLDSGPGPNRNGSPRKGTGSVSEDAGASRAGVTPQAAAGDASYHSELEEGRRR